MSVDTQMRVVGKNEFGKTVKEIQGQMKSLEGSAKTTGGMIGGSLGGMIAGGMSVVAVGAIVDAGVELTKLGASALRVEAGFKTLMGTIGSSSVEALDKLRAASLGTIDDAGLMLSANKAVMLGVATNADDLAKLLSVAAARGRNLGIDTATAFENIVTGIGRMSPLILDNLGIVTGGEKAFEAYAATLGKTAEQLTDAERKQMLVNKVLSDATPLADDAAAAFERFAATQENVRTALGKSLAAFADFSGINDILSELATNLDLGAYANSLLAAQGIGLAATALAELKSQLGINLTTTEQYIHGLQNIAEEQQAGNITIAQAKDAMDQLTAHMYPVIVSASDLARGAQLTSGALANMSVNAQSAAFGVQSLSGAVVFASSQLQSYGPALEMWAGYIDRAKASLQAAAVAKVPTLGVSGAREYYKAHEEGLAGFALGIKDVGDDALEGELKLAEFNATLVEQAPAVRQASTALSTYNDELERMRGSIESAISGAVAGTKSLVDLGSAGTVGGFDPNGAAANFGRMWDVATNGFNSQWLEPLRAAGLIPQDVIDGGEEALKKFAESKARAFQAGTDLGLLDKDKIKAQVMEQIAAQAELAKMRDQILAELSGAGVSKSAAAGALDTVLGQSGMASTGQAGGVGYAEGFTGSMEGQGAKIAAVLATEIDNNKVGFANAGNAAGTIWGTAFLAIVGDNVPIALVALLVGLVTPGVIERINKDAGRQGPVK